MKPLHQSLIKIIELLSDRQYHDGVSLGKHLKITRAAVWKAIKKLEQYTIPVTSSKTCGYRLEVPLTLLNPEKIKAKLRHRAIELDVFEKIKSTNDYLQKFVKQNKNIRVCLAEMQTGGKGRLGRSWHSPFGENIYLSMLYPFKKDISELSGLSLVVALAICKVIEAAIDLESNTLKIKWPNDVLINGQKIAGILIEIQAESHGFCQTIIGVGINVNMASASQKNIGQPWSSLLKITDEYQDRNELSTALIDALLDYLERFATRGLSAFKEEWQKRDYLINSTITVMTEQKKQQGVCVGINEQGHLLLKTANKNIQACAAGDATLLNLMNNEK